MEIDSSQYGNLVGGTYPSEKYEKSVGIIIPNIWKKCSKPPNSNFIGSDPSPFLSLVGEWFSISQQWRIQLAIQSLGDVFFHNHQQDAEKWGLLYRQWGLPSGKRLQFAIENGPVEIVDLHIEHVDFP